MDAQANRAFGNIAPTFYASTTFVENSFADVCPGSVSTNPASFLSSMGYGTGLASIVCRPRPADIDTSRNTRLALARAGVDTAARSVFECCAGGYLPALPPLEDSSAEE